MNCSLRLQLSLMILGLAPISSMAHQPVMDIAPRWSKGYGAQIRFESLDQTQLAQDGSSIDNPKNLSAQTLTQWFEGIYTFEKSLRVTLKLPYQFKTKNSQGTQLRAQGLGDPILAMPTKHYFNEEGYTGNIGVTPAVVLPVGATSGSLPIGSGAWGAIAGASTLIETVHFYLMADLFGQRNARGFNDLTKGSKLGLDLDVGTPYYHESGEWGIYFLLGSESRRFNRDRLADGSANYNSGGSSINAVPTVAVFRQNHILRAEYHQPVYQRLNGSQLINNPSYNIGIGMTFE